MTPPNIDLAKICPELAKIKKLRIKAFEDGFKSIGVDYYDIDAIAATMLKLAEENEKMRPKANAYDLACATEKKCRLPKNIDIIARKGDGP